MTMSLAGIGVSRGIAMGKAYVLQRGQPEILEYAIPEHLLQDEIKRFRSAVSEARAQLKAVHKQIPADTPVEIASFIDTHLLMLRDTTLIDAPIELIRTHQCNAEWALKLQCEALIQVFEAMEDTYLRSRKDDVEHVVRRIQRILLKDEMHPHETGQAPLHGRIVIADDLTPADTVLMTNQGIAAFITEFGGPFSHTAIIARNLGIPAIVGVRHARRLLRDEEPIIVDGHAGVIIAHADEHSQRHYQHAQRQERRYRAELDKLKGEPAVTGDGRLISLMANIELPDDVPAARRVGAVGVGLYRTEGLFMNRSGTPDEEEQLKAYLSVINGMKGAPVTIRTLDVGADKQINGGRQNAPISSNPALGLRAIRLCLKDLALFRPQLRAILRASASGPVRMMIPMLTNLQEVHQLKQLVEECRAELASEGLGFDPEMPIGGMIEVPAAAIAAPAFASQLDFLSIGTNDLIQYTLAIDRVADEVNYLYDPLHPAVLNLIHTTIQAGHRAHIPVAMCGEMAGDPRYTRLLLGLGLGEFSVQPSTLLAVKRIITTSHIGELTRMAKKVLKASHSGEITSLVTRMNRE